MNIITKRMAIESAVDRFLDAYSDEFDDLGGVLDPESVTDSGLKLRDVMDKLNELTPDMTTEAKLAEVFGDDSWTRFQCDECNNFIEVAVYIGCDYSVDGFGSQVCLDCLRRALALVERASADDVEGEG